MFAVALVDILIVTLKYNLLNIEKKSVFKKWLRIPISHEPIKSDFTSISICLHFPVVDSICWSINWTKFLETIINNLKKNHNNVFHLTKFSNSYILYQ